MLMVQCNKLYHIHITQCNQNNCQSHNFALIRCGRLTEHCLHCIGCRESRVTAVRGWGDFRPLLHTHVQPHTRSHVMLLWKPIPPSIGSFNKTRLLGLTLLLQDGPWAKVHAFRQCMTYALPSAVTRGYSWPGDGALWRTIW